MLCNAAIFFLATAFDTEVSKTFLSADAAQKTSGDDAGPPVYHAKAKGAGHVLASHSVVRADNASEPQQQEVHHQKAPGAGYLPGSPLYAGGNATAAPAEREEATFTDSNYPPVSHTMKCVIDLTSQFFIIYSALAVVKTYNELNPTKPWTQGARVLDAATNTLNFAPMLAVLFMGTRLRALQLSDGDPDKHGLPQDFTKHGMTAATLSVLLQTCVVLVIPFTLGGSPDCGDDGMPAVTGGGIFAKVLAALRWVLMIALYGGFATVVYGICTMEAPASVYPSGAPAVSPAVGCTINLCFQYFGIYLAIAVVETIGQFWKSTMALAKLKVTLNLAKHTVMFAPMLSILFIGARMRALSIGLEGPQPWAQTCMYVCSYAVLGQLLLVAVTPLLGGHLLKGKDIEGDVEIEIDNPTLHWALSTVRFAIMAAMYGSSVAVLVSVCTIEAAGGVQPAVSPTMLCVINLTCQFFVVYALLWVLLTLKDVKQLPEAVTLPIREYIPTAQMATKTVVFAPMLCVLFIGMRLRALQITNNKGAPQGYAQDSMYLCTYALMLQLLMVLITPLFMTQKTVLNPATGMSEVKADKPAWYSYVTTSVRYIALVFLYVGASSIVYALSTITPSQATGGGSGFVPAPPTPSR